MATTPVRFPLTRETLPTQTPTQAPYSLCTSKDKRIILLQRVPHPALTFQGHHDARR